MTRMQLEGAGAEELEDLSARIEAELTRRALAERGGEDAKREVVEVHPGSRGCYRLYRLERVRCGKQNCRCAKEGGELHGPYWYRYVRTNGRLTSGYVGKELP